MSDSDNIKYKKQISLFRERGACKEALDYLETQNSLEEAIDNGHRIDWLLWVIVFKLNIDMKDHAKYFVEFGETLIPFEKSIRGINKKTIDAARKFSKDPSPENHKIAQEAFKEWDNSNSVRKSIHLAEQDEEVKKIWLKLKEKLRTKYKI